MCSVLRLVRRAMWAKQRTMQLSDPGQSPSESSYSSFYNPHFALLEFTLEHHHGTCASGSAIRVGAPAVGQGDLLLTHTVVRTHNHRLALSQSLHNLSHALPTMYTSEKKKKTQKGYFPIIVCGRGRIEKCCNRHSDVCPNHT